ncbi:MAG: hypothetical protein QNI97_11605 [Desulfobacterales bacterium]|nr:hypothetical protein [Desulfobacterales bacterium]MDJ0989199.1 hypothetical protein [Desulfobacterales bacterium]
MPFAHETPALKEIVLDPADLPLLLPLLQQGVQIEVENDCSLDDLLCRQWGLERDYVLGRISTLFLNGRPVDDIETARVTDGTRLALSCAMPGLIGATMRRGGVLASFRSSISHQANQTPASRAQRALITVKLFNMLTRELGPILLARGIIAHRSALDMLRPHYPELSAIGDERVGLSMPHDALPRP